MANTNGLVTIRDVAKGATAPTIFYLRKGEPIVSPLTVKSESGEYGAQLAVSDVGVTNLTASREVFLVPGEGENVLIQTTFDEPTSGGLVLINNDAPVAEAHVFADSAGSLELSSTNGVVNILADEGLKVKPQDETNGAGTITLYNGTSSADPVYYTMYNASLTGGGVTAGNLMTFGYSGAGPRRCLNIAPTGNAITLGDDGTEGGCVVNVAGNAGPGRVYDTVYNPVPSVTAGQLMTDGVLTSFKSTAYDVMPSPNMFTGSTFFPVTKSGQYMLQITQAAGSGANELRLNGTALSAIAPGSPELSQGCIFNIQNSAVAPPALYQLGLLGATYDQIKAAQGINLGYTVTTVITAVAGDRIVLNYTPVGTPTGGLISVKLIQLC